MSSVNDDIYCTWSLREELPDRLQISFGDLDDFLRRLIISSEKSLTIVAPYLSAAGFKLLSGALTGCAERSVRLRIVTQLSGEPAASNRLALESICRQFDGTPLRHRIRVLHGDKQELFIHAKIIVADSIRGYIGSANLSARGLDRNLEIGVPLSIIQARAVDDLIDHLEAKRALVEETQFA